MFKKTIRFRSKKFSRSLTDALRTTGSEVLISNEGSGYELVEIHLTEEGLAWWHLSKQDIDEMIWSMDNE